jgi:hypothetical protein
MLPKLISKVPEAKIERMVWADEIDPKMMLDLGEGQTTTVAGYIDAFNSGLDEQLVITEEQQKDFQDALKDVLEEKQVAMTPSQRLVTVVVAQTFTLMAMGIQNSIMMRKHLAHWKEIHEERKQASGKGKKPPPPPASSQEPSSPPPPKPSGSNNGKDQWEAKKYTEENSTIIKESGDIQNETDEISISPSQVEG